jgi:hypothetical protein
MTAPFFGEVRFKAIRRKVADVLRSLGAVPDDDPNLMVGIDAGRMHLVAVGAQLQGLFPLPQQPTRMDQIVSPGVIARQAVVTIRAVNFDVQFDYLNVLSTLARCFVYVEPSDQTDPIQANRTVVAAVHRRLMFDSFDGVTSQTPTSFEVAIGDKDIVTYPNTTGFQTATGPFQLPVEALATGPHVSMNLLSICPRLPVGYRLVVVGDVTVNTALAVAFIARELTGVAALAP